MISVERSLLMRLLRSDEAGARIIHAEGGGEERRGRVALRGADGGEDFGVVGAEEREGLHFEVADEARAVNDDDGAGRAVREPGGRAVGARDFARRVGEQAQGEPVVRGEFTVRLGRVGRDADHLRARRRVVLPAVAHRAHLAGADRRLVAGVEEQDDDAPALLREPPVAALAVLQGEVGRGLADSRRGVFSHG